MANDEEGELVGYLVTFLRHLKNEDESRREFLEFYPDWREMRDENIKALDEKREHLHGQEETCNYGEVTGRLISVGGGALKVAQVAGLGICPPVAAAASAAAAIGHGMGGGFSAARANSIAVCRTQVSKVISRDYENTRDLVRMGLRHHGFLNEMQATVENIRRTTFSYTVDKIMQQFGNLPIADGVHPRQGAQLLVELFQNDNREGAENAITALKNYIRQNSDVPRAAVSVLQLGFDLTSLTGLVEVHSVWSTNYFDVLYGGVAIASLAFDAAAIGRCIHDIRSGTSVTQESVKEVRKRFVEERDLLEKVHTRLRNHMERHGIH